MPALPGPPRIALRSPCSAQALGDHPWSPARRMRLARLKIGVVSTPLKVARSAFKCFDRRRRQ
jgi:hypothetical protein